MTKESSNFLESNEIKWRAKETYDALAQITIKNTYILTVLFPST